MNIVEAAVTMAAGHPVLGGVGAIGLVIVGPPLVRLVRAYWAPKVAVWRRQAGGAVEKFAALLSGGEAARTQVIEAGPTGAEEVRRLPERV
ncbi:hypothetical protein [Streptomyces sp. NPDC056401]|uniref:hypothetical protein n=1 Tax=Streptomyces sp. NPDC056401 TaxID=3345809 RepID=UPI0035E3B237